MLVLQELVEIRPAFYPRVLGDHGFPEVDLDCFVEIKEPDVKNGITFRDCKIDYTLCKNSKCIKKLV